LGSLGSGKARINHAGFREFFGYKVRIIAGKYRGQMLGAIPGLKTRPTADRVREAWASTVESILPGGFEGITVLDAFSGSGALGLEAISRGASAAVFCEVDTRVCNAIRQNTSIVDDTDCAISILTLDVFSPRSSRLISRLGPYQLIILDPPYTTSVLRVRKLLVELSQTASLASGALVTYEHEKRKGFAIDATILRDDGFLESFKVVSCKTYGMTQIDYLLYQ